MKIEKKKKNSRELLNLEFISCLFSAVYDATCTWSGQLPPKAYKNPSYSCKVFLGGVPWDITEGKTMVIVLCSISRGRYVGSSKAYKNPSYSCKVFLGGVPWDITEGKTMVIVLCSISRGRCTPVRSFWAEYRGI